MQVNMKEIARSSSVKEEMREEALEDVGCQSETFERWDKAVRRCLGLYRDT